MDEGCESGSCRCVVSACWVWWGDGGLSHPPGRRRPEPCCASLPSSPRGSPEIYSTTHLSIHPCGYMRPLNHSPTPPSTKTSIHSSTHLSICPPTYSSRHPPIHSSTSFIHPPTYSCTQQSFHVSILTSWVWWYTAVVSVSWRLGLKEIAASSSPALSSK